jgi:hypothetical protein
MTVAYDPHVEWAHDDAAFLAGRLALRPIHGPLVDGDLCEIESCHRDAALEFVDNRGSSWLACAGHAAQILQFT